MVGVRMVEQHSDHSEAEEIFWGLGFSQPPISSLPQTQICTPPKFNMEPENHPLEKENTSSKSSFLGV